jgi:beta-phosphoglucomutase-like phosphatase (HAD superfamily)
VVAERCAVIEDSPSGVEAALHGGMAAYAYAGGLTPAPMLALRGAVVFDAMSELPALLGV